MPDSAGTILVAGSTDWSDGVDSIKPTTVASESNPNGLKRSQLAWLNNGTVRDAGITPRGGWQPRGVIHSGVNVIYQGGYMYHPTAANPYLMLQIGGHLYKVDVDTAFAVTDLSTNPALTNPPLEERAYFVQGEEFMVDQAGDNTTNPLFWDGTTLTRSGGLAAGQLPPATAMDYYMGRIWYARGRVYTAGDIVGNQGSGTLPYNFRNSVLRVTENPLAVGGDGFYFPVSPGNIRALKHSANIDASLGQGRLFAFTRDAIAALSVPVTRADWIAATANNQPLQTVVQLSYGTVSDTSVVTVNGDLYYQSLEPGIRSLNQAVRYFQQPGNIQISSNEQRILNFTDRALMHTARGIQFNNRLLQTTLPKRLPQGIVSQALIPFDFDPISSFNSQKQPNWEGMQQGLLFLDLLEGDFGGRQRAFAVTVSQDRATPGQIELWELTEDKTENGDGRVITVIEFPAETWDRPWELKKLVGCEIWADRLSGTVDFTLEFRPDGAQCWIPWKKWKKCSSRNSVEACEAPISYPLTPCLESYISTMTLPKPPEVCAEVMGRPANQGYQFQCRLSMQGFCRIRGFMLYSELMGRKMYEKIVC